MDYRGKSQYFLALKAPADLEAEGDALFAQHAEWLAETHPREGELALLQYTFSKRVNDDGSVFYLLYELYESPQGLVEHGRRAQEDGIVGPFYEFVDKCEAIGGQGPATVIHSLW